MSNNYAETLGSMVSDYILAFDLIPASDLIPTSDCMSADVKMPLITRVWRIQSKCLESFSFDHCHIYLWTDYADIDTESLFEKFSRGFTEKLFSAKKRDYLENFSLRGFSYVFKLPPFEQNFLEQSTC
jgi:hypothetical protein